VDIFQCVYETHLRLAKDELLKKINQLKEHIKELHEEDHLTKQILRSLSSDEKVPEILDQLQNGFAYKTIAAWLDHSLMADFEAPPLLKSRLSISEASDHEVGRLAPTPGMWTSVSTDSATIDSLIELYFAYIHPVHTLLHKDRFLDSHARRSGEFCSSILVNALCAIACNLHPTTGGGDIDFVKLSLEFSDTVKAEINSEDRTVTTIQAFAVMFLVDLSRSNALRAASYLKTASNLLATVEILDIDGFQEVWHDTVRGLHNLNVFVSELRHYMYPS
jgi:hypothetical protein